MRRTKKCLITSKEAAKLIQDALGINGVYLLGDNRIGRRGKYIIPYRRISNRIYYERDVIEEYIKRKLMPVYPCVGISSDPDISDDDYCSAAINPNIEIPKFGLIQSLKAKIAILLATF